MSPFVFLPCTFRACIFPTSPTTESRCGYAGIHVVTDSRGYGDGVLVVLMRLRLKGALR